MSEVSITAEQIVELFEKDVRARRRLAELLIAEPEIRLAIINAVLREVALKSDIEKLREATRLDLEKFRSEFREGNEKLRREFWSEMEKLRNEFRSELSKLRAEVDKLWSEVRALWKEVTAIKERLTGIERQLALLVKIFIAFNVPILVAVIGILLKMVFS